MDKSPGNRNTAIFIVAGIVGVLILLRIGNAIQSGSTAQSSSPAAQASSTVPNPQPAPQPEAAPQSPTADVATSQVMSKQQLERVLLSPDGAKYQNVRAYAANDNGVSFFAFCGEINGKNAVGGDTGFQRFVATPWVATTEGSTEGFEEIWGKLCVGTGIEVWW